MKRYLRAKLHNATVTGKELHYSGSIQIDPDLMELVGFEPYEIVLAINLNSGQRFETYINPGKRGTRELVLQGGAARLGEIGDKLIIMSFVWAESLPCEPKVVFLREGNRVE
ncbi:MAG: aspartate 1-decarboxylase [candidate division WOR-3 bacterium]